MTVGDVLQMDKRSTQFSDIAKQYADYLSRQERTSRFTERFQFSLWLYENHPRWVGSIEAIWQEIKRE